MLRWPAVYGPRDYLRIVEEQIRFWAIDALDVTAKTANGAVQIGEVARQRARREPGDRERPDDEPDREIALAERALDVARQDRDHRSH